jgi:hypothetical protein
MTGLNGDELTQQFEQDLSLGQAADAHDADLLGLLADFHFDISDRSRLLLAMAVIELACTPVEKRDKHSAIRVEAEEEIKKLLGQTSLNEYKFLYNIRNKVAHRLQMTKEVRLAANSAYALACRLIREFITKRDCS